MTRREIVLRAIERTGPSRLPVHYCNRDFDCSDTWNAGYGPARDFRPAEDGATEWGFVWETFDGTMGQPKTHPLADWETIKTYRAPDPLAPGRFAALPQMLEQAAGRFVKFNLGITGFNQATFLRGYEAFLMDLYTDRERAEQVLDLVFAFENGIIDEALRYPIDAIGFGDDWGTQCGLMISVDLWREVFLPRYTAQFERIRRAGKHVWFHSCGDVRAIIGDLIDSGASVIELLQPDVLGVEWLGRTYGGRVCFCCSIDHQRRAIHGGPDEIRAYARLLRDTLGAYDGGFIAYIEDYASLGMSETNYQAIREAFHTLAGTWPPEDCHSALPNNSRNPA